MCTLPQWKLWRKKLARYSRSILDYKETSIPPVLRSGCLCPWEQPEWHAASWPVSSYSKSLPQMTSWDPFQAPQSMDMEQGSGAALSPSVTSDKASVLHSHLCRSMKSDRLRWLACYLANVQLLSAQLLLATSQMKEISFNTQCPPYPLTSLVSR